MTVCIYTEHKSQRLQYVVEHIFQHMLGVMYTLTDNQKDFLQAKSVQINYSSTDLKAGIQIVPSGLLFETKIQPQKNFSPSKWDDLFCFFYSGHGEIPFDLFSASFYLLTRYEEYFPIQLDEHQRYDPKESLAMLYDFLEIPLIDLWVQKLRQLLISSNHLNEVEFPMREFRIIHTVDVDHPYLYRNKGILIHLWGMIKDLASKNYSALYERLRTVFHLQPDPYLQALIQMHNHLKTRNAKYILFVFTGNYGKYGKKTIYPQRTYRQLLRNLKDVEFGLHPSYTSFLDKDQIRVEKTKLEKILRQQITKNRLHFLQMQIPITYRILNDLGFTEDFTLGYSKHPGFRASTAIPFYFYDLEKEQNTPLLIRPFVVMDTCLFHHLKMNPEQILHKIQSLADICKLSGGDFTMIWHNSNFTEKFQEYLSQIQ